MSVTKKLPDLFRSWTLDFPILFVVTVVLLFAWAVLGVLNEARLESAVNWEGQCTPTGSVNPNWTSSYMTLKCSGFEGEVKSYDTITWLVAASNPAQLLHCTIDGNNKASCVATSE